MYNVKKYSDGSMVIKTSEMIFEDEIYESQDLHEEFYFDSLNIKSYMYTHKFIVESIVTALDLEEGKYKFFKLNHIDLYWFLYYFNLNQYKDHENYEKYIQMELIEMYLVSFGDDKTPQFEEFCKTLENMDLKELVDNIPCIVKFQK